MTMTNTTLLTAPTAPSAPDPSGWLRRLDPGTRVCVRSVADSFTAIDPYTLGWVTEATETSVTVKTRDGEFKLLPGIDDVVPLGSVDDPVWPGIDVALTHDTGFGMSRHVANALRRHGEDEWADELPAWTANLRAEDGLNLLMGLVSFDYGDLYEDED